jgi:hypothetical protein
MFSEPEMSPLPLDALLGIVMDKTGQYICVTSIHLYSLSASTSSIRHTTTLDIYVGNVELYPA